MNFWEDAGPFLAPVLIGLLVPRMPIWALPCAMAAGAAGFVLSLQASSQAVAILGAASNMILTGFAIFDMAMRFVKKKRRLFE